MQIHEVSHSVIACSINIGVIARLFVFETGN